jgi:hypothetical protein
MRAGVRRTTAAVLGTAAVVFTGIAGSATVGPAVRAEVVVAGEGDPLDVRRIRIVDGLSPGGSYRLPAFSIRNHRGSRAAYRPVISADSAQKERRPPRRWLHFLPATVVIDAGRSRAVGVRLELPEDAAPGAYAVVFTARPGGGPHGARLTFRIEPAETMRSSLRQAANHTIGVVLASFGAALVIALARVGARVRSGQVTDSQP